MNNIDYNKIRETAEQLAQYSKNVTAISKDQRSKFVDLAKNIIEQQDQSIQLLKSYVLKLSDANEGVVTSWEQAHYLSNNREVIDSDFSDN
ncbi:hypothetical protein J3L18_10820 [Mucilaginibacter gossypii]|uniref:hypothetical protein n=1 Tax=Mucilaginibacter gossypii TaxID=551996 RepID=UPI000DCBAED1|nr:MULTISPECIES: hypothetical protein [Mucilaginibacter]QTE39519.1 hypothetical protein J3L18_10820 [Mucilaginibacter gossypii]RAV56119.1 hypothetical protein DIU36_15300 [Mucilaginibacter rubeus]